MGKRGPARTPSKILTARGSWRGRSRAGEPSPKVSIPEPPKWLDRMAVIEWRRVTPELEHLGLLSQIDQATIGTYCQAYSDVRRHTKALQEEGEVVPGSKGNLVANPRCRLLKEAYDRMHRAAGQFGMTPSTRSQAKASEPQMSLLDQFARNRGAS